mgnify:CR=1 FL=1
MKLTVDQVSVAIGTIRIVEKASLMVPQGGIVGLIGPNGAGKTTLLRTVYRRLRPLAGRVLLNEADVWTLSPRASAQQTGVVVQENNAGFEFTVREVAAMGRTPHKSLFAADNQADAAIVDEALARVKMAEMAERPFHTLSGGEKQRVLVARALAQQPKLLVLDEPTNHLDIRHQLELLELIRSLGITTLITLHDLNLAAAYCQTLFLLQGGKIVAQGAVAQVLSPQNIKHVFGVAARQEIDSENGRLRLHFSLPS